AVFVTRSSTGISMTTVPSVAGTSSSPIWSNSSRRDFGAVTRMTLPVAGVPIRAMQTFLPYSALADSAHVLDTRRLGNQRVEAIQVLRALTVPGYGWRHHPAAAMWAGYEEALVRYGLAVGAEWLARGHQDTTAATLMADLEAGTGLSRVRDQPELAGADELPPWLGDQ